MNHLTRMLMLCLFGWSILNSSSSRHFKPHYYQNPLQPICSGFSTWIAHGMWFKLNNQLIGLKSVDTANQIQDAISLTPNNIFFWVNGAGIIGYDLDLEKETRSKHDCKVIALRILESSLLHHPENPRIHYELGKFFLLKKHNPILARHHFSLASMELSSQENLLLNNP